MTTLEFSQRRTVRTLSGVQVIGGLGNGAGLAVGALAVRDLSGSSGWAGLATVAITLGGAATTMPLAHLAHERGRRPALTLGWTVGALGAGLAVIALSTGLTAVMLAGLFAMGAATATSLQARFAATDRADPGAVGRALALVTWATTVGGVLGPNLTGPGADVAGWFSLPALAGPFLFSLAGYLLAAAGTAALLRPDPLRALPNPTPSTELIPDPDQLAVIGPTSAVATTETTVTGTRQHHLRGPALTAVIAAASAHAVMVAVMSMTPVHMADEGGTLTLIGLTISLHIAGMYAASPIFGWLVDLWGALQVILVGQAVLLCSLVVAGASDGRHHVVMVGLVLLGLGWSISTIAAGALLSSSLEPDVRPRLQGFSDMTMSLSGAAAGALAGVVVAWQGFGVLNAAAAVFIVPVVILVTRDLSRRSDMDD